MVNEEQVLAALTNGPRSTTNLASHFNVDVKYIRRVTQSLVRERLITGTRGRNGTYKLVPKATEETEVVSG